jgi:hypothetical protein
MRKEIKYCDLCNREVSELNISRRFEMSGSHINTQLNALFHLKDSGKRAELCNDCITVAMYDVIDQFTKAFLKDV